MTERKSNVKWSHLLNGMLYCFNSYSYANFKSTHYHTVQDVRHGRSLKKSIETMAKVPLNFSFQFIKCLSLDKYTSSFGQHHKEKTCEV